MRDNGGLRFQNASQLRVCSTSTAAVYQTTIAATDLIQETEVEHVYVVT